TGSAPSKRRRRSASATAGRWRPTVRSPRLPSISVGTTSSTSAISIAPSSSRRRSRRPATASSRSAPSGSRGRNELTGEPAVGASGGDPDALDALFRRESGQVLATLIRVLGDFELAEDALQEAMLAAV